MSLVPSSDYPGIRGLYHFHFSYKGAEGGTENRKRAAYKPTPYQQHLIIPIGRAVYVGAVGCSMSALPFGHFSPASCLLFFRYIGFG